MENCDELTLTNGRLNTYPITLADGLVRTMSIEVIEVLIDYVTQTAMGSSTNRSDSEEALITDYQLADPLKYRSTSVPHSYIDQNEIVL